MITALGIGVLGLGVMLLYAAITKQSLMDELRKAIGAR